MEEEGESLGVCPFQMTSLDQVVQMSGDSKRMEMQL